MNEDNRSERSIILFLDDAEYSVPALVHALGMEYEKIILPRSYKTIDELLEDGKKLNRVDAICLDVAEGNRGTEYDFTFGARAYRKCLEAFWNNDEKNNGRRTLFMSRWWPEKIDEELREQEESNPYKIGSGIVLPKPIAARSLLTNVASLLRKDWRAYDIEPEIVVCGISADERALYAYGIAVEEQGKCDESFRYTYYPAPDERYYRASRNRFGGAHILIIDSKFQEKEALLGEITVGVRPQLIVTEILEPEEGSPSLLNYRMGELKGFGNVWFATCKLRTSQRTENKFELDLPPLVNIYRKDHTT